MNRENKQEEEFWFEEVFSQVSRPSRYLGSEINSVHKDLECMDVKVLLAFPDLYEVGMSNLGFQILYHVLNSRDKVAAERVFAPWNDMELILREKHIPLFSLESRRPVNTFDIVGFSIQYELSFTNVLTILELGRIPLRSKHRDESDPLVIGGGFSAFNPEPMAEFLDAFVIGEGEEVIVEIVEVFLKWQQAGLTRRELLCMLAAIPGVYVPSLFEVTDLSKNGVQEIKSLNAPYGKIKKRTVSDLNNIPYPTDFVLPFLPVIHDRISLEIARGCARGCRFCQAGMVYRPVRERDASVVKAIAEEAFYRTGWEEMSLLSLSSGDYRGLEDLLFTLVARFSGHHVVVSLPSLRAETLTPAMLAAIHQYRKFGFTIAPEAGTERLRRVINKGFTASEILEACKRIFADGWSTVKLYFMVGLPTETKKDLDGIIDLAEQVWNQGKELKHECRVTVSVGAFIPKPHTPFQWCAMIPAHEIAFRQTYLRKRLKRSRFHFKWQDPNSSVLEGVMARGDRKLGNVIEEAFKNGARFDGWTECFNFGLWETAFRKYNLDMGSYLERKDCPGSLPWDHIDIGVSKDYLWEEFSNAEKEAPRPGCGPDDCHACGACDFSSLLPRIGPKCLPNTKSPGVSDEFPPRRAVKRIRLRFSKTHESRFLSHLEMIKVFARAARRAGVPLKYTEGYHPQPRIVFALPNPVGIASLEEYADLELVQDLPPGGVSTRLNKVLPRGLTILSANEIPLNARSISDNIFEISYAVRCEGNALSRRYSREEIQAKILDFHQRQDLHALRIRKGKTEVLNITPLVKELYLSHEDTIMVTLPFSQAQSIRPGEVIGAVFALPQAELRSIPICKMRMKIRE